MDENEILSLAIWGEMKKTKQNRSWGWKFVVNSCGQEVQQLRQVNDKSETNLEVNYF